MRRLLLLLVVFAIAPAAAHAQAVLPQAPATPELQGPPPLDSFTYNPEGRRDPFVSLIKNGNEKRIARPGEATDGIAGLAVDELSVRGVLMASSGYVAMVQGPDKHTFLVRANDKLFDGVVKEVTPQGLVIMQDVSDPLSLIKQKEVRKMLHANEEGK